MMQFADGMEGAIRRSDSFSSDEEAERFWSEGAAEVDVEDLTYPGGAGQTQNIRIYRGGNAAAPTLLYIHGGGWVSGSINMNDWCARGIAKNAGCNVVSISYRFAPAHPYPAALEDCQAAAKWLCEIGASLGLNTQTVAIGGASAGGNLAIATALACSPGTFAGMVLFYPVAGADFSTPSYLRYEGGPGLTRQRMQELFDLYDPDGRRTSDPLVTPQLADNLNQLPPGCLIAAEHDVLLDDSVNLATALRAAGVSTEFHTEPGVTHGFINRGRLVPSANHSIARAARFVARLTETEKSL